MYALIQHKEINNEKERIIETTIIKKQLGENNHEPNQVAQGM